PPSEDEAKRHKAKGKVFMAEPKSDQLAEIADLIDNGGVTVILDQTLPLAEVRRAHDHMEHEHVRGKIVLAVDV
ncbi:MAG TPA: zinc-binding dehydrogenase, partial [Opitutaceae bacterium]|nr:zinc-binding dehydrogenase [Opitutaceae bacterium]